MTTTTSSLPPSERMKIYNLSKINKEFDNLPLNIKKNLFKKPIIINKNRIKITYRDVNKNTKLLNACREIINDLKLYTEIDYDVRANMVIGYMRLKNFTYNTANTYFKNLRSHNLFGKECPIIPKRSMFEGKLQQRVVSDDDYQKLIEYVYKNISFSTIPIIIAILTGLRAMEILQFTNETLYELQTKKKYVNIMRKQILNKTINWIPIYAYDLSVFIKYIIENFYAPEMKVYSEKKIKVHLFNCSVNTLTNRIKTYYTRATSLSPPYGFGIHSCRHMTVLALANHTTNIVNIQNFLQHKNTKVSEVYIKRDAKFVTERFNSLTKDAFEEIKINLES